MMYAVITQESYTEDNGYREYITHKYEKFQEFESEQKLLDWVAENNTKYNRSVVLKYISFEELKIETTLTVKVKS